MKHGVSWTFDCSLGNPASSACRKLTIIERANNLLSSAELYFVVNDSKIDGDELKGITDDLIKQGNKPFQFWINSASGGKTKVWNHVIASMRLVYDDDSGSVLVVTTIDQMAAMNVQTKNRAHNSHESRISLLVESLIKESGLSVDTVQQTHEVQEFGILRQCYMTDYQFIITHLIPRSSGESGSGYRLFTKDGKKVCFQTLDHKAKDCTIEPEFVLRVTEEISCYEIHKRGGHDVKSNALSPFDKKFVFSESAGEDGKTGSTGPSWSSPAYLHYPVFSEEALSSITKAHQRGLSGGSFPLSIKIVGSDKIGKESLVPEFPMKIKVKGGIGFRMKDEQEGFLEEIMHSYEAGKYEVTLRCARGKTNV